MRQTSSDNDDLAVKRLDVLRRIEAFAEHLESSYDRIIRVRKHAPTMFAAVDKGTELLEMPCSSAQPSGNCRNLYAMNETQSRRCLDPKHDPIWSSLVVCCD
jgi:hypothetical protein